MARTRSTETPAVELPHKPGEEKLVHSTVTPTGGRRFRVRVETGDMLFSPVKYNTFNVGNAMVETECDEGELPEVLGVMQKTVRKVFAEQYQQRLEFYLKAIKYNDRRVGEESKG